jgi:pimeloyl-ACP methyl ester carboxylesterase
VRADVAGFAAAGARENKMNSEFAVHAALRPLRVAVPVDAIAGLRRRSAATRRPPPATVDDRSQGARLARIQPLVHCRGGHFAAWEQPERFSSELRAAFRPLRTCSRGGRHG